MTEFFMFRKKTPTIISFFCESGNQRIRSLATGVREPMELLLYPECRQSQLLKKKQWLGKFLTIFEKVKFHILFDLHRPTKREPS